MNNEIKKIKKAVERIRKATLLIEVLNNCDIIMQTLSIIQKEWFDTKGLINANRKLVDDKNLVINDIIILSKYIKGEDKLKYQAERVLENYKDKRVVTK